MAFDKAANARAYYLANREKIKANVAKWRENNPERVKANNNAAYAANKEDYISRSKEWQKTNRDAHNAYNREWAARNPDKVREIEQRKVDKDPEKHKACRISRAHKHRFLHRESLTNYTPEEWLTLKSTYNNRCLKCGTPESEAPLTVDHVLPLSKGGTNGIDNIQPLCMMCNRKKHAKHIDYRTAAVA